MQPGQPSATQFLDNLGTCLTHERFSGTHLTATLEAGLQQHHRPLFWQLDQTWVLIFEPLSSDWLSFESLRNLLSYLW